MTNRTQTSMTRGRWATVALSAALLLASTVPFASADAKDELDWPTSPYDYSVIGGAVNPWPLLQEVC